MNKSARQIAFEILCKIEKDKAYSNLAIDSAVRASCLSSTDCAFISHIVYGVTERKISLDYIIKRYLTSPISKLKLQVLVALRMGAYQILFLDKTPNSAAVNESVKLVKNNGCNFARGLTNAVLRKIAENGFKIDENLSVEEKISVLYSAPIELVKFLIYHYGEDNTEGFLRASLEPKKIFIKVNTTKITTDELKLKFTKEGVGFTDTILNDSLEIRPNGAVYELESYRNGYFHVEDISSQLCVMALEVFKGCTMLDLCSSPGGKSFAAAELMGNDGIIYSCDIYESRTKLIKDGAERLGLDIIKPTLNDATIFNQSLPKADRVLCDVPCSGLGIIAKKPEIKYKNLDEIKELIPIQKSILDVSSNYVKSGGRLVYSTCSINPNENRKVCKAFLENHSDFHSVKVLPNIERTVDEGDYLTLMLHKNNCDGFFIAAFERN